MAKIFWEISTLNPIVVSDDALVTDFDGYTDVEPDAAKSKEELEAEFRALRDKILAATDAMVVPDRNPPQELIDFREFLRDVPNTQPDFAYRLDGASEYGTNLLMELISSGKISL